MAFDRYKAKHGGEGPFESAYAAMFPTGILGRRGLDDERELTNQLLARIQGDDELAGLDSLIAAAQQPLTREQHQKVRGALLEAANDQHVVNSGYDAFQAQQAELRQRAGTGADEEQLGVMDSQMSYAHKLLLSSNPDLQKAGTALAGKVLDAQQSFSTTNEAQRLAKDAADEQLKQQYGTQIFTRYEQLSDDYRNESTPFLNQRAAFGRIKASLANQNSAAGDIALIFNYMKLLDPGSVVREGEFATAQNASGVPDLLLTAYNRLLRDGQRLSPEQRADFYKQSIASYQQTALEQRERDSRYLAKARAAGLPDAMLDGFQLPTDSPGDAPTDFGPPQAADPTETPGAVLKDTAGGVGDLYSAARRGVTNTLEFLGQGLGKGFEKDWQRRRREARELERGRTHVEGVIQRRPTND